jgi:hypothetical protein
MGPEQRGPNAATFVDVARDEMLWTQKRKGSGIESFVVALTRDFAQLECSPDALTQERAMHRAAQAAADFRPMQLWQ